MPSPLQTVEIDPDAVRHTATEDIQGLSAGIMLCGVGVTLLAHLGFVTGQTAGLALVIAYAMEWSFGVVFFVINLPFYAFAWARLGTEFTLKSLACVTALSVLTELIPGWMPLGDVNPLFGVLAFGALTGVGLLAVFRHKGSLGGLGVVALYAQDRFGIKAGYVQLGFDVALFAVAFALFPAEVVAYSLLGAVVLNGLIAFNHRRDRYIAP
ncbi:MAG: YitT family protein [Pseudomonadota bacterium]